MLDGHIKVWMIGLCCLLVPLISMGQQAYVRVIDAKTREAIAFAHVCFESLNTNNQRHAITDIDGKVANDCKEKTKVAVSYVGYETYYDTLLPGASLNLELKPTVFGMKEVVVTAQYAPEKADKSIYRVNVINSREIEQKGANNLNDLLRSQLNMRVSQDGVLGSKLSIQGLGGEHIKFLVDGVPVIGRMDGNIDLSQINLNNVDHVEVIEGPMSVIYGSNALAGVINIITKENKVARLSAHADSYYESVGVYDFNGGVSMNKKKHVFSLEGGRYFFDGYPETSSRVKSWKPKRQFNLDGYYVYQVPRTRIKAGAQFFDEKLVDKDSLIKPYYEKAFDHYYTTRRLSGRFEGNHQLDDTYSLNLLASWSDYTRIKKTYFKDLTTLEQTLTTNPEDQDTTGIGSYIVRCFLVRANPDLNLSYQTGIDVNIEDGQGKRIAGKEQEIGDYAAFLSLKYEPLAILSLQPGIRLIYNTKYQAPLVYSLSARWALSESWALRTSYSRGFRAPAIKELYLYFKDTNHDIEGNPDLKAENSNNFNANINFTREKKVFAFQAEASAFYNLIDNIITLAQSQGTSYTYINLEKFKTLGGEAKLSMNLYPRLRIQVGVSHTGRLFSDSLQADKVDEIRYATDLSGEMTYKFPKRNLNISLYYKLTGNTPNLAEQEGRLIWTRIPAYHTMDISASKSLLSNRLRLSAGVKNLFDNTTISAVGGDSGAHSGGPAGLNIAWGRSFFLKLGFYLNKYNKG